MSNVVAKTLTTIPPIYDSIPNFVCIFRSRSAGWIFGQGANLLCTMAHVREYFRHEKVTGTGPSLQEKRLLQIPALAGRLIWLLTGRGALPTGVYPASHKAGED
jgi:hypothetical protein